MYHVELAPMLTNELDSVAQMELERIAWLWRNVHTNNLKACPTITHCSPARATVGIQ